MCSVVHITLGWESLPHPYREQEGMKAASETPAWEGFGVHRVTSGTLCVSSPAHWGLRSLPSHVGLPMHGETASPLCWQGPGRGPGCRGALGGGGCSCASRTVAVITIPRLDSPLLKHTCFIFIVYLFPLEAARDILFVSFSVKPPSFSIQESMICKQTPPCTGELPHLKAP